jgi:hypothetical protein
MASGVKTVVDLDWWESARHSGTKIDVTFTPAQVRILLPIACAAAALIQGARSVRPFVSR